MSLSSRSRAFSCYKPIKKLLKRHGALRVKCSRQASCMTALAIGNVCSLFHIVSFYWHKPGNKNTQLRFTSGARLLSSRNLRRTFVGSKGYQKHHQHSLAVCRATKTKQKPWKWQWVVSDWLTWALSSIPMGPQTGVPKQDIQDCTITRNQLSCRQHLRRVQSFLKLKTAKTYVNQKGVTRCVGSPNDVVE